MISRIAYTRSEDVHAATSTSGKGLRGVFREKELDPKLKKPQEKSGGIMKREKMIEVLIAIVIGVGSYYAGVLDGTKELAQTMKDEYVCIEKKW